MRHHSHNPHARHHHGGGPFGSPRVAYAVTTGTGSQAIALGHMPPSPAVKTSTLRWTAQFGVGAFRRILAFVTALVPLGCVFLTLIGAGVFRREFIQAIGVEKWATHISAAVQSVATFVFAGSTVYRGVDMVLVGLTILMIALRWALLNAVRSFEVRIGPEEASRRPGAPANPSFGVSYSGRRAW